MYHDHALTLLRWLAYARSPPTLSELVEAAVIDPIYESSIDSDNRGDLEDTLNILSGLVSVEESMHPDVKGSLEAGSPTHDATTKAHGQADVAFHGQGLTPDTRVRLAHFSVKEYLESQRILKNSACQFYLDSATGHGAFAQSCLTYLCYYSTSPEKTLTKQDLETFPLLRYAARSWFYHCELQNCGGTSRELSFLQKEQVKYHWLLVYDPDTPWEKPFSAYRSKGKVSGSAIYYASLLGHSVVVSSLLQWIAKPLSSCTSYFL